jgi:hypothetical protein
MERWDDTKIQRLASQWITRSRRHHCYHRKAYKGFHRATRISDSDSPFALFGSGIEGTRAIYPACRLARRTRQIARRS